MTRLKKSIRTENATGGGFMERRHGSENRASEIMKKYSKCVTDLKARSEDSRQLSVKTVILQITVLLSHFS